MSRVVGCINVLGQALFVADGRKESRNFHGDRSPPLEAGEVGPAHPRQLRELLLRQSVALPEHLDPITRY